MSYRPKGWKASDIRKQEIFMAGAAYPSVDYEIHLVEAGANAIIEALREQGMRVEKGCISCVFALPPPARFSSGYIAFIPEETP